MKRYTKFRRDLDDGRLYTLGEFVVLHPFVFAVAVIVGILLALLTVGLTVLLAIGACFLSGDCT